MRVLKRLLSALATVVIGGLVVAAFRCTPAPDEFGAAPPQHAHAPGEYCWFCDVERKMQRPATKAQIEEWSRAARARAKRAADLPPARAKP